MVVDLPQPFEPRKPKISPLRMRKLTWSTATKSPKRMVRSRASMAISAWSSSASGTMRTGSWPRRFSSGKSAMKASSSEAARPRACSPAGVSWPARGRRPARSASRSAAPRPCRPWPRSRSWRALGADGVDQVPELRARQRVHAGGRFVQDQQVRSWISAQHSPSFCFMPPDSLPAGRDRKAAMPVLRVRLSMRRRRSAASWPNSRPKNCRFSSTDRVG